MTDRGRLYITDVHQPSMNRLLAELAERDAIIAKVVQFLLREPFERDLSAELQRAVTR